MDELWAWMVTNQRQALIMLGMLLTILVFTLLGLLMIRPKKFKPGGYTWYFKTGTYTYVGPYRLEFRDWTALDMESGEEFIWDGIKYELVGPGSTYKGEQSLLVRVLGSVTKTK